MKECNKCGVELVIGENWPVSTARNRDYRCQSCRAEYDRKYCQKNPDKVQNRKLLYRYNITLVDYRALLTFQRGRCALCDTNEPGGRGQFKVDHDHVTGAVRGLLCHLCNVGLGHFELLTGHAESYLANPPNFRRLKQSTSEQEDAA